MKYLDIRTAHGDPKFIEIRETLFKNKSHADKVLAFALFIFNDELKSADLWYIQSNVKGMGLRLMELAQAQLYEYYRITKIYTNWEASTVGGRKVCVDAGFKRDGHLLIWERKADES